MATRERLTTADELLQMPDDGRRYELIQGKLNSLSPGGYEHGAVIGELTGHLWQFVRFHELGKICGAETGFLLETTPDTLLAPDIAFVRAARAPTDRGTGYYRGAPDLAVEVMPPNDSPAQVEAKAQHWLTAGAQGVWVVDPARRCVAVWHREAAAAIFTEAMLLEDSVLLPGFAVRVAELFRAP
ncbi:MAG: Uma2 family endonuclease [Pirellulales bacterium]|nr:Uma2 family endonuclease [Pirellulales bacterium]